MLELSFPVGRFRDFPELHGYRHLPSRFSGFDLYHNVLMEKFGWFNYCLNTLWSRQ